jgi:5-methylcytosine-specific restriction endonuclease McrA
MAKLNTLQPRLGAQQNRLAGTSAVKRMTGNGLQRRRLAVWTKSPHCAACGRLVQFPHGFELDHITPLHKGGADSEDNCQVLCAPNGCHDIKTRKDLGQAERAQFDPGGRVVW